jgi:PAS domain S-box-containing protein
VAAPGRVLIAGASSDDCARVAALVDGCSFDGVTVERAPLARAAEALREQPADVLVCAVPDDARELRAALAAIGTGPPTVLCVAELTAEVASLAHAAGARVCLYAHGPAPLRLAILRAAEEAAARRQRTDEGERVRALVHQSVSDVVFHLRVEGGRFRFIEVNPAFLKATGLDQAKVVGRLVDDVIPPSSLPLVLARYREAIAEQRTVRWEEVTPYPAGLKYGEVSVTPMVDTRGECTRLVGTVRDVTEARHHGETIRLFSDIVRAVQIGLMMWSVPDDPGSSVLLTFNPAAERLWGEGLSRMVGRPIREVAKRELVELVELIGAVAADGQVREPAPSHLTGDARYFATKVFPLPGGRVGLAFEDVTVQTRARSLAASEQRCLEMVASGRPLRETLDALACAIEEEVPSALASLMLVSVDGARLVDAAAPHLPEEYRRAVDGAPVAAQAGSCSAAAAQRRPVIVGDVEVDPISDEYRELARRCGLRASWSTPISTASGRVLGVFALLFREPRSPTAGDLEIIARSTHVAAIAIQRHELDEQLRELSAHLDAAREEERTGIAREIHDQLGQALTVLKMDLAWIARRGASPEGVAREALLEKVGGLMQQCDESIEEVRRISSELRPPILDHVGLGAALAWKAEELEKRSHLACRVMCTLPDDVPLERGLATAVFRVFQESLTNVVRHAGAAHVDVRLDVRDGALVLVVGDDGRGITQDQIDDPRSLGLLGIRERARRLGGTVTFGPRAPHGTEVTLRLPLVS